MSFIKDVLQGVEKILLSGAFEAASMTGVTKGSTDNIIAGDVELLDITLMSEDRQKMFSLLDHVKTIDIYESMMSPTIFAELGIADAIGLLQDFPINGEEYVTFTFNTPKNTKPATYLFRVNQIKDKKVRENNKMLTYTLQLVSAEMMRNSVRYVTKNYDGNISDIITDILKNDLQTEKNITVDKTSGIEKGLITRKHPFKAIDYLRKRAVSSQFQSSSFVFYENRNGYYFTTIERLMDSGEKDIAKGLSDKEFYFDTVRKESISDVTIRNIIAYNQVTFNDTISLLQQGGLNNVVNKLDMISGNFTKIKYDDIKSPGDQQFKFADGPNSKPAKSANFTRNHGKTTAVTKLVPVSAAKPNTLLPEKLSKLQVYAQKISQNIVQIYIYGDTDINVGDMITCYFPSATAMDNAKPVSRLDSGNYLVTKVRHMIINSDRPQHTMSLELIKGGLTEVR